ncbi:MAG: hypothetical protein ACE5H3_12660, partial [Planctomycetota bacterium]
PLGRLVRPFSHPPLPGYELLDSGTAQKLERFGAFVLRRPDPQALWRPRKPAAWERADLRFERESDRGGVWTRPQGRKPPPPQWPLDLGGVQVLIRPTPFKHVGLFPEQAANWAWIQERGTALSQAVAARPLLLNLFGYTGVASLQAARTGWQVTHVDASRTALDQAAANLRLNRLAGDAVRWILDDATAFAAREVRRGRAYHGILLDPPHYGRGPKGQKWVFEEGIAPLLEACGKILAKVPGAFLILSTYAIGCSALALEGLLQDLGGGRVEAGELALPEKEGGRLLPCGFCARFVRE